MTSSPKTTRTVNLACQRLGVLQLETKNLCLCTNEAF